MVGEAEERAYGCFHVSAGGSDIDPAPSASSASSTATPYRIGRIAIPAISGRSILPCHEGGARRNRSSQQQQPSLISLGRSWRTRRRRASPRRRTGSGRGARAVLVTLRRTSSGHDSQAPSSRTSPISASSIASTPSCAATLGGDRRLPLSTPTPRGREAEVRHPPAGPAPAPGRHSGARGRSPPPPITAAGGHPGPPGIEQCGCVAGDWRSLALEPDAAGVGSRLMPA